MDIKISFDIDKLKEKTMQATSLVKNLVMNYTEIEAKVLEATNNDAWGASGTLMADIAKSTYNYEEFEEVMSTIYKRFAESGSLWRHIYKALSLLEYLIKNGSEKVVDNAKDHIYDLKALMTYQHVDDKGKDQGINVRNRAKEIVLLLQSPARIQEERAKAKSNRDKYIGVSSDMSSSEIQAAARSQSSASRQTYDDAPRSTGYSSNFTSNYDDEEEPAPKITRQSAQPQRPSSTSASKSSTSASPAKKMPQVIFNSDDAFGPPASASGNSGFGDFG
jgi:epsin